MAELKREYVVPLRRKTNLAPKWRRSKKAVTVLNDFIKKHMKSQNVIICNELNEKIWENGIKNPPGKVSVVAVKTDLNGVEKTLVNLAEVGVDNQLKTYQTQAPVASKPQKDKKEEAKTDSKKEEIKDAEVKEVKKEKAEEKKIEAKKETSKKPAQKKEAKK